MPYPPSNLASSKHGTIFMVVTVLFVWSLSKCIAAQAKIPLPIENLRPKLKWTKVEPSSLRKMVKKDGYKRTFPIAETLQAISRGHSSFITVSHKIPESGHDVLPKDYDPLSIDNDKSHDVHFTADFKQNIAIFSLDEVHHAAAIKDIDDDYLMHCPAPSHQHAEVGDIFVASEHGHSVHSRVGIISNLDVYMKSPDIERHEGFKIIRRVLAKSPVSSKREGNCMSYETEDIHPFEMFDSIDIHGNATRRFGRQYSGVQKGKRRLQGIGNTGILHCSDNFWSSNFIAADSDGLLGNFGGSSACVEYSNTFGGIALNYDYSTNTAINKDIDIMPGVVCHDCYAFVGPHLLFNVQYSYSKGFGVYVGLSGGYGYNVDLKVNNPSISGSLSVDLVSAEKDKDYHTILYIRQYGITLSDKHGGLKVDLSGSGSATGSAELTAGNQFSARVWAYYNYQGQSEVETDVTNIPPFSSFAYTQFKTKSFNLLAQFTLVVNVKLTWGYSYVSVSEITNFNFMPFLQYSYPLTPTSSSAPQKTRGGTGKQTVLAPGETVKYAVDYQTNVADQVLIAYYSIANGINSYPIMQQEVKTLSNGYVTLELEWTLPWDIRFLSAKTATWRVHVHVTNMLVGDEIISEETFVFQSASPFLSWPLNGTVVLENSTYELSWNASLLCYFYVQNTFFGAGEARETKNASISLYDSKCSGIACIQQRVTLATNVINSGKATLVFPVGVAESGVSYYLTVESMECDTCKGWSEGVFYVKTGNNVNSLAPSTSTVKDRDRVIQLGALETSSAVVVEKPISDTKKNRFASVTSQRELGQCVTGVSSVTTTLGMKTSMTALMSAFSKSTPSIATPTIDVGTLLVDCRTDPNLLVCGDALFTNNGGCSQCNQQCSECVSATVCTGCTTGLTLSSSGQCAVSTSGCSAGRWVTGGVCCPLGSYYPGTGSYCLVCATQCSACASSSTCLQCNTGYYLDNGGCSQCDQQCSECVSATVCTGCTTGLTLSSSGQCALPTSVPTRVPTRLPSPVPTRVPTRLPSPVPTRVPTQFPSPVPTRVPTRLPSPVSISVPTPLTSPVPTSVPTPLTSPVSISVPTPLTSPVPTSVPTPLTSTVQTSSPTPLLAAIGGITAAIAVVLALIGLFYYRRTKVTSKSSLISANIQQVHVPANEGDNGVDPSHTAHAEECLEGTAPAPGSSGGSVFSMISTKRNKVHVDEA